MICSVLFCKFHLRTMHRCSSEKKGQSSLTRDHMVRRNSKALFRNSATECSTFTMHCNDGDVKRVHPLHLDDGDFDFSDDHLLILNHDYRNDQRSTCFRRFLSLTRRVSCGTAAWTFNIRLIFGDHFQMFGFLKMSRRFSQKHVHEMCFNLEKLERAKGK